MAKIQLDSLKQCLQFLEWLRGEGRGMRGMRSNVALELIERKSHYYNWVSYTGDLPHAVSKFLDDVSKFYNRLCFKADGGSYDKPSRDDVFNALLECVPKLLTAMYFLLYNVDASFSKLGGGGWRENWPGYETSWWFHGSSGGPLQEYLRAPVDDPKYGKTRDTLPGGFEYGEIRYGRYSNGYIQGYFMTEDLKKILNKENYNDFRDIFLTTVISMAGTQTPNTANAVGLVGMFCDIVIKDNTQDGGELKRKLEDNLIDSYDKKCIHWQELKSQCKKLKDDLNQLINDDGFSYTGQAPPVTSISQTEFARKTAEWLKEQLSAVRTNVTTISSDYPDIHRSDFSPIYDFAVDNIFPYGFTFGAKNFGTFFHGLNVVPQKWKRVLGMLKSNDGLEKLRTLLEGEACPKFDAVKHIHTSTEANKTEVGTLTDTKTHDTKTEGKRAEGAQNRGEKEEGTPNPRNGKNTDAFAGSSVGNSDPRRPSNSEGIQDTAETGDTMAPGNAQSAHLPDQQTVQSSTHGSPPTLPGYPSSDSPPNVTHTVVVGKSRDEAQGSMFDALAANLPISISNVVFPQTPSASDPIPAPSGGHEYGAQASADRSPKGGKASQTPEDLTSTLSPAPLRARPRDRMDRTSTWGNSRFGGRRAQVTVSYESRHPPEVDRSATTQGTDAATTSTVSSPCPGGARDDGGVGDSGQEGSCSAGVQDLPKAQDGSSPHKCSGKWVDGWRVGQKVCLSHEDYKRALHIAEIWERAKKTEADQQKKQREEEDKFERMRALRQHYRQQDQLYDHILAVEGYAGAPPLSGKALPAPPDPVLQKQQEEGDKFQMYLQQRNILHGSDIKPFKKKPFAGPLLRPPKRSRPPPPALHNPKTTVATSDVYGIVVPNIPKTKPNVIDTTPHVENLDDYPVAFLQHVAGADLKNFSIKDVKASGSEEITQTLPPMPDFNGTPIFDPNLSSSPNPTAILLPSPPHPIVRLQAVIPGRPSSKIYHPRIDLSIQTVHHEDRTVDDIGTDDPQPPPELQPLDPIGPYTPAISLNLETPEPLPELPNNSAADYTHNASTVEMCLAPWTTQTPTHGSTDIPETELFLAEAPRTVRDMLQWLAGLKNEKHHETLEKCINKAFSGPHSDPSQLALSVNGSYIRPKDVFDILQLTAMFAGSVLTAIAPRWRANVSSRFVKPKSSDQSEEPDCCALLCQLRDYVYASHHQLEFLKSQCKRHQSHGGWQDCHYGSDVSSPRSPLQSFLTDGWDSAFETHLFDSRNICLKSRVSMGFKYEGLPDESHDGRYLSTILSPTCGGEDPLVTLSSYLVCLTRRTPRTTGELVSFFHHFGNELHLSYSREPSNLGTALSTSHADCPKWDRLEGSDLDAVRQLRGSDSPISSYNHTTTLFTLLGCQVGNAHCHRHCSPITYRAYALYSPLFSHTYLSWTVYLPDRLLESLERLSCDLGRLQCSDISSIHNCAGALPILYTHGFTPPEGTSQSSPKFSTVVTKLEAVLSGDAVANLMTCMDAFLYRVRMPFIFLCFALWSVAMLLFAHTILYRVDIWYIRSHIMRYKVSHLIDVKVLLTLSRNMPSLYDIDYFDDDEELPQTSKTLVQ
ncbi:hypothetical protein BBBOND_0307180 [Babesia bigemina]|uniref:Ribosome-binding protein 1 n=1 Tax=Babesia bigemina TaxID=5866 RepID=A0A061DCQ2_BABBI|nr:hypothetical protein BBBOND_0307180 [Babesia bigemina]CDR96814.1 hypothetical protein BBBOND_0307180 [Babesia bigemina]|eukprot:XP_012769000.1 hypothetical protein BBBOND_0307180 [Babesia bigemina]